jgi:hypothetical protein
MYLTIKLILELNYYFGIAIISIFKLWQTRLTFQINYCFFYNVTFAKGMVKIAIGTLK